MKKILLSILTVTAFGLGANAQDSTGLQIDQGFFDTNVNQWVVPKTYMQVPTLGGSTLHLDGSWTLETMVKMPSSPTGAQIHLIESYSFAASTGGYVLRISGNKIQAYVFDQSNTYVGVGATDLTFGEWNHVAAVFDADADKLKIYLNGVLESTSSVFTSSYSNNTSLYIGARGDDQSVNDHVVVDEVRIWDVARTGTEINAAKDVCLSGSETGLVAYYDFEGLTSSIVLDKSSNANNGNIVGGGTQSGGVFDCVDNTMVTVDEQLSDRGVSIYPNPVNDRLNIQTESALKEINIYNLFGELVRTETSASFSVIELVSGVYLINVLTADGVQQLKFIKK